MTCREPDGEPAGITVNSFTSVSLEPRLILWNIANFLAADQQAVSEHFAQLDRPIFDNLAAADSPSGQPVLADCIGYLHCHTDAIHEGGDHYIIVGEVERFELGRDADPLLYYGSRYRTLAYD